MPGNKHLRGATAKENRQYTHIKNSYIRRGKSTATAKRLAAMTVNAGKGR